MLSRSLIILIATSVCTAHASFDHQANVGQYQSLHSVEQQQSHPHHVETSDLNTDSSTWWRNWNKWGRSWNYNHPTVSYSSSYPSVSYGSSHSYPSVSQGSSYSYPSSSYGSSYPSVSYASSYPTYYTEKTHYIYTPKTYTYYEPTTYSTYYSVPETSHQQQQWVEPEVSYQSHGHGHQVANAHERW